MPTHEPTLAVYRHASDLQAYDCGRACAQSLIASVTQGVPIGKPPNPSEQAQPVAATQNDLRQRESVPVDAPGNWFTHPDELVEILKEDPELQRLEHLDWRVAAYDNQDELLEHVGLTIKRGFPAILNLRPEDHWVTVRGVDYDSGVVSFLYMLDPLNPRSSPGSLGHTYVDGCATDGTTVWETLDLKTSHLGTWSLPVGSFPPANYAGKYVAIVYGPSPKEWLESLAALRARIKRLFKRPKRPTPPLRIREELLRVADATKLSELSELLAEDSPLIVRHVQDIEAKQRGYTIAALFSQRLGRGLVGVFDFTDQHFHHLRLTADRGLVDTLAGDSAEPLWWTQQPLETLYSPYFPFRRDKDVSGRISYRRLFDDLRFTPMTVDTEPKRR